MAIAFVQEVGGGASATGQTSFTSTAASFTAGNCLVAVVWWSTSGTSVPTGISLPAGWTAAGTALADGAPNGIGRAYYMPNNPGGSQSWTWSVTLNGATAQGWAYSIFEFSGVATSSPVDLAETQSATGSSSSSTHDPGAATGTTASGDLLITLAGMSRNTLPTMSASASSTPSTGWTVGTQHDSTVGSPKAGTDAIYQVLTGTATNPDGIITTSTTCSGAVFFLTLKAPGGTTFTQSVTVSTTTSPSVLKQAGKLVGISTTTNPALIKQVGKVLSVTSTTAPTVLKQVGKVLAVTTTTSAALTKQVGKVLSVTTTTAPAILNGLVKLITLSVTTTTVPTIINALTRVVTLSVSTTTSALTATLKTLAALSTGEAPLPPEWIVRLIHRQRNKRQRRMFTALYSDGILTESEYIALLATLDD